MSTELRLVVDGGHLFLQVGDGSFLLDTGAPQSFGTASSVSLDGEDCPLSSAFMGLTSEALSDLVHRRTDGLLGGDVLNRFDWRLDVAGGVAEVSRERLAPTSAGLPLRFVMGVPLVDVTVAGETVSMFFDTGAQVSYWQADALRDHPPAGPLADFYPGFGAFDTETFSVPVRLGAAARTVRCGQLPTLLGMTLMIAGAGGIVGNEILQGRQVFYLPRRGELVLE